MALVDKIKAAIVVQLEHKGYELVDVTMVGCGSKTVVDISIDRMDEKPVSIDDCVVASRMISMLLDVEDIIHGKYDLNVGSPGEYRQIESINDFRRFCGRDVKIELRQPINSKKKIFGKLLKVEQEEQDMVVHLCEECNTGSVEICLMFKNIKKAGVKRAFNI